MTNQKLHMATAKKEWPKLPKAFKTKWLKALRSGDYVQGRGALVNSTKDEEGQEWITGYCCLGVAADVCGVPFEELKGKLYPSTIKKSEKAKIPDILLKNPASGSLVEVLSEKNDGEIKAGRMRRESFKQIANWIERNL